MISVKNLTKKYGNNKALDDISFEIKKGEIVGFLGPNGAGKSTTMNIVTGYLSYDSGEIEIDGANVLENPKEAKKKIGYLPEIPPLYLDMTPVEYLNFLCELKNVKFNKKAHVDEICDLVQLGEMKNRLIKKLSKGYRQRVGFAGALIGNPEILILDEPTVGLDPNQIIEIRKLILRLSKDHTVILSSHILQEITAVCERIIIINRGKIIADDTKENLIKTNSDKDVLYVEFEDDAEEIADKIAEMDDVTFCETTAYNKIKIKVKDDKDIRKDIFNLAVKAKNPIIELKSDETTLEDVFARLTGREEE
jgi:ABC-2 type transport system ATP-binding protein